VLQAIFAAVDSYAPHQEKYRPGMARFSFLPQRGFRFNLQKEFSIGDFLSRGKRYSYLERKGFPLCEIKVFLSKGPKYRHKARQMAIATVSHLGFDRGLGESPWWSELHHPSTSTSSSLHPVPNSMIAAQHWEQNLKRVKVLGTA
jgi:hypothetical protein